MFAVAVGNPDGHSKHYVAHVEICVQQRSSQPHCMAWSMAEYQRLAELIAQDGMGNWGPKTEALNAEFHHNQDVRSTSSVQQGWKRFILKHGPPSAEVQEEEPEEKSTCHGRSRRRRRQPAEPLSHENDMHVLKKGRWAQPLTSVLEAQHVCENCGAIFKRYACCHLVLLGVNDILIQGLVAIQNAVAVNLETIVKVVKECSLLLLLPPITNSKTMILPGRKCPRSLGGRAQ